jgi:hypothetical protein
MIVTQGDLNASPVAISTNSKSYEPLAYKSVKGHRLNLRSVLNDDLVLVGTERNEDNVYSKPGAARARPVPTTPAVLSNSINGQSRGGMDIWTTWKARRKQGKEKVSKQCIDYILYTPSAPSIISGETGVTEIAGVTGVCDLSGSPCIDCVGVRALGALDLLTDKEVGPDFLPSSSYPSDHIAIAADLEIVGRVSTENKILDGEN